MTQKPIIFYATKINKERIRIEAEARNLSISSFCKLCIHDWLNEHSKKPTATTTRDVNAYDVKWDLDKEKYLPGRNPYGKDEDTDDSL